jgi:hypothetical protein
VPLKPREAASLDNFSQRDDATSSVSWILTGRPTSAGPSLGALSKPKVCVRQTQVSPSWLPLCGNSSVLARLPLSRPSTSTPYGIVKSREVPRDHINRGLPDGGNRTSWARGTLGSLCGRNTGRAGLTLEGVLAGVGGKRAGVGWLAGASWPVAGAARGCLMPTVGEGC